MRTVADAMVRPVVVVEPSATIQSASAAMLDAGTHAAVVVDGHRVFGLASAEDVATTLAAGRSVIPVVGSAHEPLGLLEDLEAAARG